MATDSGATSIELADVVTLGATVGSSATRCALVRTEHGLIVEAHTRLIDHSTFSAVGAGDRLASGFDLLENYAGVVATAAAVATDTARLRGHGRSGIKREVSLVADPQAAYAALTFTGEIARYPRVLLVDLGAASARTHLVTTETGAVGQHTEFDRGGGNAFDSAFAESQGVFGARVPVETARIAKETLATATTARVTGGVVSRNDFDAATAELVSATADHVVTALGHDGEVSAQAVVLLGGGANLPTLVEAITVAVGRAYPEVAVLRPSEPESVMAIGAAIIAQNPNFAAVLASIGRRDRVPAATRAVPIPVPFLVGALVIGAFVAAVFSVTTSGVISGTQVAQASTSVAPSPIASNVDGSSTSVRTATAPPRVPVGTSHTSTVPPVLPPPPATTTESVYSDAGWGENDGWGAIPGTTDADSAPQPPITFGTPSTTTNPAATSSTSPASTSPASASPGSTSPGSTDPASSTPETSTDPGAAGAPSESPASSSPAAPGSSSPSSTAPGVPETNPVAPKQYSAPPTTTTTTRPPLDRPAR